jgi:heat shock protein HslJ
MVLRSLWAALAVFPLFFDANAREVSIQLANFEHKIPPLPGSLEDDSALRPPSRQDSANGGVVPRLGDERGFFMSQTDGPFSRSSGSEWSTGSKGDASGAGSPMMQGLVTFAAGSANFEDCASGSAYPISAEGDFAALEHAYLAAGNEPGIPVLATFDGEVVENEADGDDAGATVLVERFVGVWPGMSCERAMGEVSLTDTYWKIVSLYDAPVTMQENGKEPHMILLGADARFTATLGCNQFMGDFSLQGRGIRFGRGASSTRMACRSQQAKWESLFRDMIAQAKTWEITDGILNLLDDQGNTIAAFQSVSLN